VSELHKLEERKKLQGEGRIYLNQYGSIMGLIWANGHHGWAGPKFNIDTATAGSSGCCAMHCSQLN